MYTCIYIWSDISINMAALVISSVILEAHNSLSADRISYFAYNEDKEEFECMLSKDIVGLCVPKTAGYIGKSFNDGILINAKEIKEEHYEFVDEKSGYKTKNLLCAPLFDANGNKIGVVQAVNKLNNNHFTEDDEQHIQEICRILSMYLSPKNCNLLQEVLSNISTHIIPTLEIHDRNLGNLGILKWHLSKINDSLNDLKNVEKRKTYDVNTTNLMLTNNEVVSSLPSNLLTWDFNAIEITELPCLSLTIMKLAESLPSLPQGLDNQVLASYIQEVSTSYNVVPFHNFQHATCVTHALYMFIMETEVYKILGDNKTFGLFLSAVVHDVDHPGNTNTFEVNSGSELAMIYNDKSVLENHHCAKAFRLMRRTNCGVLNNLDAVAVREIRKVMVTSVLATDMAIHFQMVSDIEKKIPRQGEVISFEEDNDKLFICSVLLHAADLSNPVRRFDMTKAWAMRVAEEFNKQIEKEKEIGLPFLSFMATPDEISLCRNEIGFGSHVVMPYVKNVGLLFPQLSYVQSNLSSNIDKWKERLNELQ